MSCKAAAATAKTQKKRETRQNRAGIEPSSCFGDMNFGWHVLCEI